MKYDTFYCGIIIFDLISLNPISVKNWKFDRLICLIISNIVAFWTEASKLTESEITTKMSSFAHYRGDQAGLKVIKNSLTQSEIAIS